MHCLSKPLTSETECLSEKLGLPLYVTDCADLGTEPDVLEQRLYETFLRGVNWGSIILLDDADALVLQRSQQDRKRSAVVSILLRHLEYSDGIHFITTSSLYPVDRALLSRIHIPVGFNDFQFPEQQSIWLMFIERIDGLHDDTTKAELASFITNNLELLDGGAYMAMNGRQIRNCIDASLALARSEGESILEPRHIRRMLRLGWEFREFLKQHDTIRAQSTGRSLINNPMQRRV